MSQTDKSGVYQRIMLSKKLFKPSKNKHAHISILTVRKCSMLTRPPQLSRVDIHYDKNTLCRHRLSALCSWSAASRVSVNCITKLTDSDGNTSPCVNSRGQVQHQSRELNPFSPTHHGNILGKQGLHTHVRP